MSFVLPREAKAALFSLLQIRVEQLKVKRDAKIEYWGLVPVIEPNYTLGFSPPFNIFEPAVNWLSTYPVLKVEDFEQIIQEISELYDTFDEFDKNIEIQFFVKPIYGINGYLIAYDENQIFVMFWAFDNLIEGEIS